MQLAIDEPQAYLEPPPRAFELVSGLVPAEGDLLLAEEERDRYIQARINQRIAEIEVLPSTLNSGEPAPPEHGLPTWITPSQSRTNFKLDALVELRSLQLLPRQRAYRHHVATRGQAPVLQPEVDRTVLRKAKKSNVLHARMTEALTRKRRDDQQTKERQRYTEQLQAIMSQSNHLLEGNAKARDKTALLARTLLRFHTEAEREEAKRIERLAKERLNALKADDEEAYLKLIDTAKDTRITHLLGQTDKYLDNLTQAVRAQQNDHSYAPTEMDESAFGASRQMEEDEDKNKVNYYSIAHRVQEKVDAQPTILVGGQLKEYQIKGLQWMVSLYNNHLNGILADEMGLGKTIQTISLVTYLIESKRQRAPYLVIVPLSTLQNWVNEFAKWAPSVSVLVYKGGPNERKELSMRVRAGNWQVLLTTYEFIIKDKHVLGKVRWVHMIIDEGHRMKNAASKLSVTLTQFYNSQYRLLLTGTPLQNNLPELWALLNFVLPKVFNSAQSFDEWFNTPFANAGGSDAAMQLNEEEQLLIIKRLHKVLRPFLLRRLKKDVESELPDKVEKVIKCTKSALQARLYGQVSRHKTIFTGNELGGATKVAQSGGIRGLQNMLMQLRKICQHPYVFDEVEAAVNPTKATGADLYRVSGKFELLDRILPKLKATGHRVLMFFQMTQIMDIMEDYLRYRDLTYLRLDGSTKQDERGAMLHEFNKPDSPYFMFILSTRAGGLGLNLQTADTVIIFDSDFNPHQDLQAQDRAHRIGQKMEVRIFRLVTEKSVEEKILEIAHRKLDMDGKVIQAGRFHESATNEERDSLLRAMLENADEDAAEAGDMTDEEINAVLARTPEEETVFGEMDEQRAQKDQTEWEAQGNVGPAPPRLITEPELPEQFQQEYEDKYNTLEEAKANNTADDGLLPRRRRTAPVRYNDELTESQFLAALENDEDPAEVAAALRERAARKRARKSAPVEAEVEEAEDEEDENGDAQEEQDTEDGAASPHPAPRPRRSASRAGQVKRKRVSEEDEGEEPEGDDDFMSDASAPPPPKKIKPKAEPTERNRVRAMLRECYEALASSKDETGRARADLFFDLPSAKLYPDYRSIIQHPVSMRQIRRRIDRGEYRSPIAASDDVHTMCSNAQSYNEEGSWVWEDAAALRRAWDTKWGELAKDPDIARLINRAGDPTDKA